jgi:hypothetical protein
MTAEENMRDRDYPCTYKVHRANRRFVHGFGIFLVAFFLVVTPLHLLGVMKHPLSLSQLTLIDISVVAFVVWGSLRVERRVTLYEDGIEVAGWRYSRKLRRDEIRGRRMGKLAWQAGGGSYYIIVPSDQKNDELKLPFFLHVDKHFRAWMKAIPEVNEPRS